MDRSRSILLFDARYDQMLDYDTIINNITTHIQYYSLEQPDLDIKHLLILSIYCNCIYHMIMNLEGGGLIIIKNLNLNLNIDLVLLSRIKR